MRSAELLDKPIGTCSKGQKQRVGMAQALLHDPEVLIHGRADHRPRSEPDQAHARAREEARPDAHDACCRRTSSRKSKRWRARVLLVNDGRLAFDGTPAEFKSKGGGQMDQAFYAMTGNAESNRQ
jgi:ABC-2 type transport system ATP-binding protein